MDSYGYLAAFVIVVSLIGMSTVRIWLREEMKADTSLSNEQVAVIAVLIHQLIVHLDWAAKCIELPEKSCEIVRCYLNPNCKVEKILSGNDCDKFPKKKKKNAK